MPRNVLFVAACNPFQLKSLGENKIHDIALTHPQKSNFLSHKVSPIAHTMLTRLHDYGSLDDSAEREYIRGIISSIFGGSKRWREFFRKRGKGDCLVEATFKGQKHLKRINNNESSMSLRDVHRVKVIFEFYYALLAYEEQYSKGRSDFAEFRSKFEERNESVCSRKLATAFLVSIYLNYIVRIGVKSGVFCPTN